MIRFAAVLGPKLTGELDTGETSTGYHDGVGAGDAPAELVKLGLGLLVEESALKGISLKVLLAAMTTMS